jgi:hypothetical protein
LLAATVRAVNQDGNALQLCAELASIEAPLAQTTPGTNTA